MESKNTFWQRIGLQDLFLPGEKSKASKAARALTPDSIYKYILEKEYGMKISSMILAVIHPQYDRYYAIKLSNYREKEVTDMLEAIDMINN